MACMEKTDARKLKTEVQQVLRNQVIRLREAGKTYKEICEIFGIHHVSACHLYCQRR